MKPFPCKTVNRTQNKTGKIEIFCKCRTPEGGKMVSCTGCREWYHEECMQYQNIFEEKNSNIGGTVATAKCNRVYRFVHQILLVNTYLCTS